MVLSWEKNVSLPRGQGQPVTVQFSVAGSGPVPVLSAFFGGLGTEDRTGPAPRVRTGTGTAVLPGPERTAVRSSVQTSPGPKCGPDQS